MERLIKTNPKNPQIRLIERVVGDLKKFALIIYTKYTIYGLVCYITHINAMYRFYKVENIRLEKVRFFSSVMI